MVLPPGWLQHPGAVSDSRAAAAVDKCPGRVCVHTLRHINYTLPPNARTLVILSSSVLPHFPWLNAKLSS